MPTLPIQSTPPITPRPSSCPSLGARTRTIADRLPLPPRLPPASAAPLARGRRSNERAAVCRRRPPHSRCQRLSKSRGSPPHHRPVGRVAVTGVVCARGRLRDTTEQLGGQRVRGWTFGGAILSLMRSSSSLSMLPAAAARAQGGAKGKRGPSQTLPQPPPTPSLHTSKRTVITGRPHRATPSHVNPPTRPRQ